MTSDKVREIRLRNWANRLELSLHKSKKRLWSVDDHLKYMIIDSKGNTITGERFELDLDAVEKFLKAYEEKLKSS